MRKNTLDGSFRAEILAEERWKKGIGRRKCAKIPSVEALEQKFRLKSGGTRVYERQNKLSCPKCVYQLILHDF